MNQNKKIISGIVGIIILAGAFYGGMVYGGNNVRASVNSRGTSFNQNGLNSRGGMINARNTGGFINGQIISKDNKSITVALLGGGSKIIFLDSNTKILKSVNGTTTDLATNIEVSITGTPNADGSISAQSIQIRPTMPTPKPIQ